MKLHLLIISCTTDCNLILKFSATCSSDEIKATPYEPKFYMLRFQCLPNPPHPPLVPIISVELTISYWIQGVGQQLYSTISEAG